jgi:hypothetical protein
MGKVVVEWIEEVFEQRRVGAELAGARRGEEAS